MVYFQSAPASVDMWAAPPISYSEPGPQSSTAASSTSAPDQIAALPSDRVDSALEFLWAHRSATTSTSAQY